MIETSAKRNIFDKHITIKMQNFFFQVSEPRNSNVDIVEIGIKKVSSKQNVHGIMYIISCCHSNIKTLFSHTVHTKVYSVFYPLSLPSCGVMASICKQLLIRPFFINQMYLFHKLNIENKAYCLSNV